VYFVNHRDVVIVNVDALRYGDVEDAASRTVRSNMLLDKVLSTGGYKEGIFADPALLFEDFSDEEWVPSDFEGTRNPRRIDWHESQRLGRFS